MIMKLSSTLQRFISLMFLVKARRHRNRVERLDPEGSPDRCEVCVHERSHQNKMNADLSGPRRRTTGRERGRSAPVGDLYDFSSLIPAGLCACSSQSEFE
jgi:hypothetical protein